VLTGHVTDAQLGSSALHTSGGLPSAEAEMFRTITDEDLKRALEALPEALRIVIFLRRLRHTSVQGDRGDHEHPSGDCDVARSPRTAAPPRVAGRDSLGTWLCARSSPRTRLTSRRDQCATAERKCRLIVAIQPVPLQERLIQTVLATMRGTYRGNGRAGLVLAKPVDGR
jgi:hypothetical protein